MPGTTCPVPYLQELPCHVFDLRLGTFEAFGPKGDFASDLRGALGKALHGSPHYDRLFEPPLPKDAPRGLQGGQGAPRPFVLAPPDPPELGDGGGAVRSRLVVFGRPAAEPEVWLRALKAAARNGFGLPRASFRVLDVAEGPWVSVAEYATQRARQLLEDGATGRLRLTLQTPARLFSDGDPLLPSPCGLVNALLRRFQALAWIYGSARVEVPFEPWLDLALHLEESPDLIEDYHAASGRRLSYRQKRKVPLDGACGWWEAWVPWELALLLAAGELVGVGKATTSGLGRMRLTAPMW